MNKLRYLPLLAMGCLPLYAQDTTAVNLQEVTVTAALQSAELKQVARQVSIITARQIAEAPVKTLDGILTYARGVDVRTRSPYGVQADVSIRGGHYEQTLILLDGVRLNDPQTGHHTLNLPVPLSQIERIEILSGGASRVFGPAAFSGVINIITKPIEKQKLAGQAIYGQHQLKVLDVFSSGTIWKTLAAYSSVQLLSHNGYTANTQADRRSVGAGIGWSPGRHALKLQYQTLTNKFGASNFYHPKFYNQSEQVAANLLTSNWQWAVSPKVSTTLTYLYRRHTDVFDFNNYYKTTPNLINYHQTDVQDTDLKIRWLSKFGKSTLGGLWRQEKIISNRLGERLPSPLPIPMVTSTAYTNGTVRTISSAFIEHQWQHNNITIIGGTLLNYTSGFGVALFPGLDASYAVSPAAAVYASANKSLRYPTFTELYLNTASVIGDPTLKPESAWNYEIGWKYRTPGVGASAAVFHRRSDVTIDRILRLGEKTPRMVNFSNINFSGAEAELVFDLGTLLPATQTWNKRLTANYAYTIADAFENGFQSFYTLNYLRHKVAAAWVVQPIKNWQISTHYQYRARTGNYQLDAASPVLAYQPVSLVDIRTSYTIKRVRIVADIMNVFNKKYVDFAFVEQPTRWISGGLQVEM